MEIGLLALHVLVGLYFVGHGAQKLFGVLGGYGIEGTGGFFESLGIRPGRLQAAAAGAAEFVGGILLALGLLVPLGALLVTAVMTVAILTVHWRNGLFNADSGVELPLVYIAVGFALAAVGGGDLSLDAAFDLDVAGLGWAIGALALGVAGGLGAFVSGRLSGRGADDRAHATPA